MALNCNELVGMKENKNNLMRRKFNKKKKRFQGKRKWRPILHSFVKIVGDREEKNRKRVPCATSLKKEQRIIQWLYQVI